MLARLKPGAVLINAARGDLVDEHAIAKALESGALAVMGQMPSTEPPTGSPLLTAPNVVLTPHIGAFTDRANELGVPARRATSSQCSTAKCRATK